MMDTIKHKLLTGLKNCGSVPDALARQSWEYYHGVYLIHMRHYLTGQEEDYIGPSVVLKPLKLGAVKAFLVGELLAEGQKFFREAKSHDQSDGYPDDPPVSATILPAPVKTPGGSNYIWSGGNRYLLTAMIKGREADYHRQSDLQAAICTMKTFHRFTRKLITGNQKRWVFLRFNPAAEWRKRLREMEICREMAARSCSRQGGGNDDWSRQYLSYWPEFYDQAREVVGALENLTANMRTDTGNGGNVICYHDWAYHNIIIDDGVRSSVRAAFLIDFDDIIVDRPVHDRANLISRYLRLNSWSPTALTQILTDFDRSYEWESGELEWLRIYLAFPYEFWMLARQYFIEKQPWSMKYYQDQWQRKIACQAQRRRVLEMLETSV